MSSWARAGLEIPKVRKLNSVRKVLCKKVWNLQLRKCLHLQFVCSGCSLCTPFLSSPQWLCTLCKTKIIYIEVYELLTSTFDPSEKNQRKSPTLNWATTYTFRTALRLHDSEKEWQLLFHFTNLNENVFDRCQTQTAYFIYCSGQGT